MIDFKIKTTLKFVGPNQNQSSTLPDLFLMKAKLIAQFWLWKRGLLRKRRKLLLLRRRLQIRSRHYVTLDCLQSSGQSAWSKLWSSGTDTNFLAVTSLTREAFDQLHLVFCSFYRRKISKKGGRPEAIHSTQALGCLLQFYTDRMDQKSLCMLHGIAPASMSRILYRSECALLSALSTISDAQVRWPSKVEQMAWAQRVALKNPLVQRRWGFIDGKNFPVQKPTNADLQNAMYNGWLHSTLITGTLCYGADGTIIWAKHNFPGSWNDGETSRRFQQKLLNPAISLQDHGVLSDSAFPVAGDMFTRILTPLKEGELERAHPKARRSLIALSEAITSLRQPAEWGMGSMEKVYHRLLNKLPYCKITRGRRLKVLMMLYNYRVRRTGISQIRTYFFTNF